MKKYAIQMPGFPVRIMTILDDQVTPQEELPKSGISPVGLVIREIAAADLPADRYFRNAWKVQGVGVQVDIAEARQIKLEKITELRDEKLAEVNIEYLEALNSGDQATIDEVAARRQALIDLPAVVDLSSITDLDELKNFTPPELL